MPRKEGMQGAMIHTTRIAFLRIFCLLGTLVLATPARVSGALVLATTASATDSPLCSSGLPPPGQESEGVQTRRTTLAGVPAILRIPRTVTKPPIVLWHGLGPPASEADLMEDLPLDDVPAVKVYLGLPLFGARAPTAESDSLMQRQAQDYALRIFDPVVVGAARELPAVLAELRKQGCLRRGDAIGLFGFSAGGTAVLITLLDQKAPVRVAVTVNAPTGLRS